MLIPAVDGEVHPEQMGVTFMHEHVFLPLKDRYRDLALDYAELELKTISLLGAGTLVDVGPWRWRKTELYKQIASRIPELNIICCTGYPWGFESIWDGNVEALQQLKGELEGKEADRLADELVEEITGGIMGSAVKAGLIKVGSNGPDLNPLEEKLFTAAGKAQSVTGVPICTHCITGASAQMKTLEAAGADLDCVYHSHIEAEQGWEGRSLEEEAEYLAGVARNGDSLFFNNFALERDTPWPDLVFLLKYLKDSGLSDRILIGMDWNFHINDLGQIELEDEANNPETVVRVPSYIFTWAIPALKAEGFTDGDIEQWLVKNPRRIFSKRKV